MTEAQADALIAAVERTESLLQVVAYFTQATAWGASAAAGLLLSLVFIRALMVKRILT